MLASGALFAFLGGVVARGLQFCTQIALARTLGNRAFGLYALGWTLLRLLVTIGHLGMDVALVRFGTPLWAADRRAFRRLAARGAVLALGTSAALATIWYACAAAMARAVFSAPEAAGAFRAFALCLPIMAVLRVASGATLASLTTRHAVYAEKLVQPGSQLVLVLLALTMGLHLSGAIAALAASALLGLIPCLRALRAPAIATSSGGARPAPISDLLSVGVPAALAAETAMLNLWLDRLVIGGLRPPEELGIYQASSQLALLFGLPLGALGSMLTPLVAMHHADRNASEVARLHRLATKWALYCLVPTFIYVAFSAREVLLAAFGSQYAAGGTVLVVLTAGQLARAATGPIGRLLLVVGAQKAWFRLSLCSLALNVALNLLLVPVLGMVGAAAATLVSTAALSAAGMALGRSRAGVWPYDMRLIKLLGAAGVMFAALLAAPDWLSSMPQLRLAFTAATATGSFALGVWILGPDPDLAVLAGQVRFLRTSAWVEDAGEGSGGGVTRN